MKEHLKNLATYGGAVLTIVALVQLASYLVTQNQLQKHAREEEADRKRVEAESQLRNTIQDLRYNTEQKLILERDLEQRGLDEPVFESERKLWNQYDTEIKDKSAEKDKWHKQLDEVK